MTDDHNDENQHPDDVLRCPVCDAIFYHLDAYELHLTYHCVDDMYSEKSEIMDEITDFSLETVPPIAEKEQLFELTMDDTKHKKKKHKKHKKSKKSAITLDQFLNMNTDVFGEDLDFQGIEEVPSQIITKRLKKPTKKQAQSKLLPNIEKLKRQGIVIKKKAGTTIAPPTKPLETKKVINKTPKIVPQTQSKTLATPNDVLTKLINQNNSQLKIVKRKSGLEIKNTNEDTKELQQDSPAVDDQVPVENTEPNGNQTTSSISKENNDLVTQENKKTDDPGTDNDAYPNNTSRKSQIITNPEKNTKFLVTNDEDDNKSQSILDEMNEEADITHTKNVMNVADKLTALRNNSNIIIKSSQQSVPNVINNKVTIPSNDADGNISDHEEETDPDINGHSDKNDSLYALKHLSHLIVKSCIQEKNPASKLDNTQGLDNKVEQSAINKIAHLMRNSPAKIVTNTAINPSTVVPQSNIPLKAKVIDSEGSYFGTDDEIDEPNDKTVSEPVQANKLASILNSPHINIQTIKKSPIVVPQKESQTEKLPKNEKSSADLLKHLKNVTAKPVSVNKTVNAAVLSPKLSPKLTPNTIKKEPATPSVKHSKAIQEDVEIFNIDDSDSDEAYTHTTQITKPENKESPAPNKSVAVLKNINKNITIKSVNNHNTSHKDIDKAQVKEFDSDCDDDVANEEVHRSPLPSNSGNPKLSIPQINQKQSVLNNVLKNLSKNITVKSGNTSPGHFTTSHDQNSRDSPFAQEDEGAESDTDSLPGRVKITEMDNASDEEVNREHTDMKDNTPQDNVKVQYPDDSNSDKDEGNYNEEFDRNFSDEDIETHIPANAVKNNKNYPISNPNIDSLKNVCKDLVIKPPSQTMNKTSQLPSSSDEIPPFAKSLSNQISIKNIKQGSNCNKQVATISSNSRNTEPTAGRSMNKSAINQKMASSSNQVNTVNKEVKTIKTFQSQTQTKTVIQEITTTVTKTIKTVNQSMKQEIRNTGQSSSAKIQQANNINFQGIKVRQTAPMVGPRVRNPGMRPTRPSLAAPIRASNQLVPVRPRFNSVRQSNPRMPIIRPSISGQLRPQFGAQVKVAPGVITNTVKRPNPESPGHFSCFKKPKESLFPETDFSHLIQNKHEGEPSAQFSSTMQMSKSNFACTTKTVKGNSVVTSTQMKSEISASSQQLGKLRNLSGLSIVKTSQANQSHTEEISATKQNTLDAIQKLQSQGLLVKKPRLVGEENEHSNPVSDNEEHFSDEEHDS
ncbi:putative zinc finger protein [Operophtera brumata]|uniref:Putative zinc finger protein n=1 Tax=Operophtera brumata TaxID=104452 RepID=A0A0L7LFG5_OPEBR|nr:putative zinc finger protein [Operophtera brumata]